MEEQVTEKVEAHVTDAAKQAGGFFRSRYGLWSLGGISFLESATLVPLVTDPFLVAYILSDKTKVVRAVVVTTLTSVVGGICAYFMAVLFFEAVSHFFFNDALLAEFDVTSQIVAEGFFVATLIGAFTPLPYTLVGLAAGFIGANIWVFLVASFVGRGARYVIVGWGAYTFGERALEIVRKRIILATVAGAVLVAVYIALHL